MKICEISGIRFQSGNNVSHAQNKTRRRFHANIQRKRLFSSVLGFCSVRITPKGLKTIESKGGLDIYLNGDFPVYGNGIKLRKRYKDAVKSMLKV